MRTRCLAIAIGLTVFTACGSSPLAPTRNEITAAGLVIWTDPEHGQFVVSSDVSAWSMATVTPATRFVGDVRSATALFSAFQTGSRLDVTVIGSPIGRVGASGHQELLASSVTSARSPARLLPNGWGDGWGQPPRYLLSYNPQLTAVVWYHNILVVRPWTVFDPTGDITTYEGFLAAASTGELVASTSANGDAWLTGFYTFQARSLKVTRTSK
jgi:hypothetical protein